MHVSVIKGRAAYVIAWYIDSIPYLIANSSTISWAGSSK